MGAALNIPADPAEFFERFLPQQFTRDCHRYRRDGIVGAALFEVFGVGSWGLRRVGDTLAVSPGRPDDVVVQIGVSGDDFTAVFVERTQREIDSTGDLSEDSRDVFKPLFIDARLTNSIAGAADSVAFDLTHDGTVRTLFI